MKTLHILFLLLWVVPAAVPVLPGCADSKEHGGTQLDTDPDGGDAMEDAGSDADIPEDTDTGPEPYGEDQCEAEHDPLFRYSAQCLGDTCADETGCCDGATCASGVFGGDGYKTHYCYPVPDESLGTETIPCECGDLPVSFGLDDGGEWTACLATGNSTTTQLESKVLSLAYMDGLGPNGSIPSTAATPLSNADMVTTLGDKKLFFSSLYSFETMMDWDGDNEEDDKMIVLEAIGSSGLSQVWLISVYIPAENWKPGVLQEPTVIEDGETKTNYYARLMRFSLLNDEIDKIWLEGIVQDGWVEVIEPGAAYDSEQAGIKATFAWDLYFFELRTEIE